MQNSELGPDKTWSKPKDAPPGAAMGNRPILKPSIGTKGRTTKFLLDGRYLVDTAALHSHRERRVWRATDTILNKSVILKGVLSPLDSPPAKSLLEEYHRQKSLRHRQVPQAYDWGACNVIGDDNKKAKLVYFTQQYIAGPTLAGLAGHLSDQDIWNCFKKTTHLLCYLHRLGWTKLDLKPTHLILSQGVWHLIDLDQAQGDAPIIGQNALYGTLPYLAPEILLGNGGGWQADLYSLGATFYEAVTGEAPPLHGETLKTVQEHLPKSDVPLIDTDDFPIHSPFSQLVASLMARSPLDRPKSAASLYAQAFKTSEQPWLAQTSPPVHLVALEPLTKSFDHLCVRALEQGGAGVVIEGIEGSGRSTALRYLADTFPRDKAPVLCLSAESFDQHSPQFLYKLATYLCHLAGKSPEKNASIFKDSPGGLDFDAQIQQLTDRLIQLSRMACKLLGAPLPVFIDDIEALDHRSSNVLRRFAAYAEESSGLILALASGPNSNGSVEALSQPLLPLPLAAFSSDHIRSCAERSLGADHVITTQEANHLLKSTGGWAGPIRAAIVAKWHVPDLDLQTWTQQDDAQITAYKLAQLSPEARNLIEAASIFKQPVGEALLVDTAEVAEGIDALQNLVDRGWMAESRLGNLNLKAYRFSKNTLRQSIYSLLDTKRRQALHQRAAEQLEAEELGENPVTPETLGYHFLGSGNTPLARAYLRQAVDNAYRTHRLEDACELLSQLLQLEASNGGFLLRLGKTLVDIGNYSEAISALTKLLKFERLSVPQRSSAQLYLAKAYSHTHRLKEAAELLGPAVIGPESSEEKQLSGGVLRAWLLMQNGELEAAECQLKHLASILPSKEQPEAVDVEHLRGLYAQKTNKADEQLIERLHQVADLALNLNYGAGHLKVLNLLARLYMSGRRYDKAVEIGKMLVERARISYDLSREATANHNLALTLNANNDPNSALEHLNRASALYRRLRNEHRAEINQLDAAEILLQHGRADRAAALIDKVESRIKQAGSSLEPLMKNLKLSKAHLAAALGKQDSLQEQIQSNLAPLLAKGDYQKAIEITGTAAKTAMKAGHISASLQVLDELNTQLPATLQVETKVNLHLLFSDLHHLAARTLDKDIKGSAHGSRSALNSSSRDLDWLSLMVTLLEAERDEVSLAETLAKLVGQLFGGRALVFLFQEDGHDLVSGSLNNSSAAAAVSRSLLTQVRQSRRPVISMDVDLNPALTSLRSLMSTDVGSIICWPVLHGEQCLGALYVDHPKAGMVDVAYARSVMDKVSKISAEMLEVLSHRRADADVPDLGLELPGQGRAWNQVRHQVNRFINTTTERLIILLQGETGSGKSRLAKQIHSLGRRSSGPFVRVDCPSILPELFASEMFGLGKGTATGVLESRDGFFNQAKGGTLVLDEIAELDEKHQKQLLTVLQEWEFHRPGDHISVQVDCDVILASNRDLNEQVNRGNFREDLYFRIATNRCYLPPLREASRSDIGSLLSRFISSTRGEEPEQPVKPERYFSRSALNFIYSYHWPGNMRELENLFKNEDIAEILRGQSGRRVERQDLERNMILRREVEMMLPPPGLQLKEVEQFFAKARQAYVIRAVELQGGNKVQTAKLLGAHRSTLYNILGEDIK